MKNKKCSCGEEHISNRIQHCYDGKPCYVKEFSSPEPKDDWRNEIKQFLPDFKGYGWDSLFQKIESLISTAKEEERAKLKQKILFFSARMPKDTLRGLLDFIEKP